MPLWCRTNMNVPSATLEALRSRGLLQLRAFSPRCASAVAAGSVTAYDSERRWGGCAYGGSEGEKSDQKESLSHPSNEGGGTEAVPRWPAGMQRLVLVTRADASL